VHVHRTGVVSAVDVRAARRGDEKQTKKLIRNGADVNCRDYAGTMHVHVLLDS